MRNHQISDYFSELRLPKKYTKYHWFTCGLGVRGACECSHPRVREHHAILDKSTIVDERSRVAQC